MSICAAWPNDFSHSEQVWVFDPLWVSMCLLRTAAWPNDLWHWIQLYALTLVWVTMCLFRPPDWPNDFWHSEQMWILSPLEVKEWLVISVCFGVEHSEPWRLSSWTVWFCPVPVQRLLPLLLFNFHVELSIEQLFLTFHCVSIEGKNDEGMDNIEYQYWSPCPCPWDPFYTLFRNPECVFTVSRKTKCDTQKNRHNFRNCSFFVTRGPQTDLLEEVEIFVTHGGPQLSSLVKKPWRHSYRVPTDILDVEMTRKVK